ncbi:MAG TPA: hypothetical protein PLJ12_00695, partial [Planctomycetota bacterium]|nr:hypothetical protein [Planctomycetota bacterium]
TLAPAAFSQARQDTRPNLASSNLDTLLADWQGQFGPQWHVRSNPLTGTMEMLYGGKAPAAFEPRIGTDSDWFQLTRYWVDQTHAMHGVFGLDLVDDRVVFLPLAQTNTTDKITVALRQEVAGVPVEDGRVNALYSLQGELLSLHSTSAPRIDNRSTRPALDAEAATQVAMRTFAAEEGLAPLSVGQAQLLFAHVDDQEARRWTLAWQIDVQNTKTTDAPVGHIYTVDANTGAVLKQRDSIHFFDVFGTLYTKATPGTTADRAANPPVDQPMPYARITSAAGTVYTDANGNFSYPGVNTAQNLSVQYYGTYTDANNDQGADYSVTFNAVQPNVANSLVMNSAPTEFVTSQANAYLAIANLRNWIRDRIPGDATADFLGAANCNLASTCNAYYDGVSTNYYAMGGGCNNTGFSSVVAHEVGHWLNDRYGTGNGSDGMGEGNADVFALYLYDDPILGSFFFTGGGYVRTGNNTRPYCGDGNGGCYGEVHNDGEPWMGAAWNVRQYLNTSLGNVSGDLTADLLFLGWMNAYNQSNINSIIEIQWLTLDDNDGDINNGTPNYQSINQGFVDQNFPGFDLAFISFTNNVPIADTRDEDGPYVAQVDMSAVFNPPVASGSTFYRVNGGAWSSVPMSHGAGNTWTGNIPGILSPATVEYYIRGTDNTGGSNEYPAGGASNALSFRVGTVTTFLFNDFEGATNEGWTGGVAGDTASTGIWTRGNPLGTDAQPEDDHTDAGVNCWFTGQGSVGGALGENDVDGGATTLLSPMFNAAGLANAKVSYWRWYSNNSGSAPNADTFVVSLSGDNGATWTTVETVGPTGAQAAGGWYQHTVNIAGFMTPTATMRLRFVASDTGSGSIVEAAIDDVQGFSLDPSTVALGTNYCGPAVANSSGFPGFISAVGSPNVVDNEVKLSAFGMPSNQFGFFLNGTAQGFTANPGGSAGNLCLGGTLGRYNQLNAIFNTGNLGYGELDLDLTQTPTASGTTAILAGQTWNFQCWYRDTANVTSNFTDAISINF